MKIMSFQSSGCSPVIGEPINITIEGEGRGWEITARGILGADVNNAIQGMVNDLIDTNRQQNTERRYLEYKKLEAEFANDNEIKKY